MRVVRRYHQSALARLNYWQHTHIHSTHGFKYLKNCHSKRKSMTKAEHQPPTVTTSSVHVTTFNAQCTSNNKSKKKIHFSSNSIKFALRCKVSNYMKMLIRPQIFSFGFEQSFFPAPIIFLLVASLKWRSRDDLQNWYYKYDESVLMQFSAMDVVTLSLSDIQFT